MEKTKKIITFFKSYFQKEKDSVIFIEILFCGMIFIDVLAVIMDLVTSNKTRTFISLVNMCEDINRIYVVFSIAISFYLVSFLCLFSGMIVLKKKERIDKITETWDSFDFNEFLENNKYISLSSFSNLYTSILAILYFLFSFTDPLKKFYDENIYFKSLICLIALSNVIAVSVFYNRKLRVIRCKFIDEINDKNKQNFCN